MFEVVDWLDSEITVIKYLLILCINAVAEICALKFCRLKHIVVIKMYLYLPKV